MDNQAYQDLELGYVLLEFTGAYDSARVYSMFQHVTQPDGKSYVYINAEPTAGNAPPNSSYWMLFSDVGDLTALKVQLAAAISAANSAATDVSKMIDARIAELTQDQQDAAEVVDARMGAASLRERMTSIRAMWYHSFFHTDGKIYTVSYDNATMASVGTRENDAVGMTANPSTDTVRGANDFDRVPIFHSFRANGYVDTSGEFVVTAVEGEPAFALDGSNGDVWALFKPCWFKIDFDVNTDRYMVSDMPHGAGWFPTPGAVRPDSTLRPVLPIACYRTWIDAQGIPHSISGKCPANHVSHNSQITTMRKKGAQYSGMTSKDMFHLTTLMTIEYATRHEKSVVYGCLSYNYQYKPAVTELGVERFVLSAANAANIIVGSCVSVGNPDRLNSDGTAPNTDRYYSAMNAKADRVLVTRKEELPDGNVAVYLDNGGKTFDTIAGSFEASGQTYDSPTYLSTMPWYTGSTDGVLGPTGSPGSLTSGRYDMRYRYVETFWGNQYVILADVIRKGDTFYVCDDCTKYATSLTSDYAAVGYSTNMSAGNGWIKRIGFDPAHPSVMEATEIGADSSKGYCSHRWINSTDSNSLFAVWAGCSLYDGSHGGPRARSGSNSVGYEYWNSALRLSATGRCGRVAAAA